MNKYTILTGGLLTITAIAGTGFVCASASADVVDDINITVPVSCSLSGTNLSQTADIRNGIYTDEIGSANIKATCTDTAGFDIYAIGYTDDTYGNNKMHDSTLSTDYDIPTGKYTQGTTTESVWSMKLIPATGTYTPIIRDDSTYDYTDYEVVPAEYTKVAYREAGTDYGEGSIGANFATKYAVYADIEQPAGEYTGQVKFTLVHPNEAPAPTPPSPVNPPTSCTTPVPNLTYMQDLNSSNKTSVLASMTEDAQYYLADKRDDKAYCVAKLKDGNIWMTQNLDLDLDSSKTYTPADTDISANWTPERSTYATGTTHWNDYDEYENPTGIDGYNHPESYDPGTLYWSGTLQDDTPVSTGNSHHHLGNYYNWTAAVAVNDSSSYTTYSQDVNQSICPANWTLPKSGDNTSNNSFRYLVGLYNYVPDNDSWGYMTNPYPYNDPLYFNLSGYWRGSFATVGSGGDFWSPIVSSSTLSDNFFAGDDGYVDFYYDISRQAGMSVRCLTR